MDFESSTAGVSPRRRGDAEKDAEGKGDSRNLTVERGDSEELMGRRL